MPRLFLGIQPPLPVRAEIERVVYVRLVSNPLLRVTRPENWHITVHFIGNVTPFAAKKMVDRFEKQTMGPGGNVALGGHSPIGAFGNEHLFLRVNDLDGGLTRAHADAQLNFPVKANRKYSPHLTLARNKREDLKKIINDFSGISLTSTFPLQDLFLFDSQQVNGETHYVPLASRSFLRAKTPSDRGDH